MESVPLLANSKENNFVGVNLYVDDTGSIKQLPINPRASDICRCCGQHIQVHGDAWIARFFDDEDGFRRLDFHLSEVSSAEQWVRTAKAQRDAKAHDRPAAEAFSQLAGSIQPKRQRSEKPLAAPQNTVAPSSTGAPPERKHIEPPPPADAARVQCCQLLSSCIMVIAPTFCLHMGDLETSRACLL